MMMNVILTKTASQQFDGYKESFKQEIKKILFEELEYKKDNIVELLSPLATVLLLKIGRLKIYFFQNGKRILVLNISFANQAR